MPNCQPRNHCSNVLTTRRRRGCVSPPPELAVEDVTFLEGNVLDLDAVFDANELRDLPRPWLVIEDSAHTAEACRAALVFFARNLQPGEWIVMEDGILDDLGRAEQYEGGPNSVISKCFGEYPDIFLVLAEYCDMLAPMRHTTQMAI